MQQIGVLGASFNPPTLGHQDVIAQAFPHFDEILLVPSLAHAFQKKLLPISHRLAMMKLLIENFPSRSEKNKIKINNIEADLLQDNPKARFIYTYDMLVALSEALTKLGFSPFQLHFILGPDVRDPKVWQKFYRFQDIEKNWPLFIAQERIPFHSTGVREIIKHYKDNMAVLVSELEKLVGLAIAEYIIHHRLYFDVERDYE